MLGQGGGSFAPAVLLKVGTQPTEVAIADLNGDGKPDLATSNWKSDDVSVLIGTGTGSFRAARSVGTGGAWPESIASGDLNKDGKADLAVATHRHVVALLGKGDGTFREPKSFDAGGANGSSVAIGDLNGDSNPDLAVTFTNSGVSVLVGDGTGSFDDHRARVTTADGLGHDARSGRDRLT